MTLLYPNVAWEWPDDDNAVLVNRYVQRDLSEIADFPHPYRGEAPKLALCWYNTGAIAYLMKVAPDSVQEMIYYAVARHLDVPHQVVLWGKCPGVKTPIAAIRYEPDAVWCGRQIPTGYLVETQSGLRFVANPLEAHAHATLFMLSGAAEIPEFMVRGETLFGVDAGNAYGWFDYILMPYSSQLDGEPAKRRMMQRYARELGRRPIPERDWIERVLQESLEYGENARDAVIETLERMAAADRLADAVHDRLVQCPVKSGKLLAEPVAAYLSREQARIKSALAGLARSAQDSP